MRLFFVLASVFALGANAAAQDGAPALTLSDALREARRANPDLIALQRQHEAAAAMVPESRALMPPLFETQIWGWPVTTLNPGRTDMYMFMGEQELPGRGKRAARELVATREADMSRAQIATRANEVFNQ